MLSQISTIHTAMNNPETEDGTQGLMDTDRSPSVRSSLYERSVTDSITSSAQNRPRKTTVTSYDPSHIDEGQAGPSVGKRPDLDPSSGPDEHTEQWNEEPTLKKRLDPIIKNIGSQLPDPLAQPPSSNDNLGYIPQQVSVCHGSGPPIVGFTPNTEPEGQPTGIYDEQSLNNYVGENFQNMYWSNDEVPGGSTQDSTQDSLSNWWFDFDQF